MSDVFFRDLDIRDEAVNLAVGSGTHAEQTGAVMRALESTVAEDPPRMMLTFGDVNSTLAAALVAAKSCISQGHVEAGLRSGDPTMPEEVNRVITDRLADLLFTHSDEADDNLRREGVDPGRIHNVGNVMIDSLVRLRPRWQGASAAALGDIPARYGVVTLHRPSNVDEPERLGHIVQTLSELATEMPLIFPVHPRTRERLGQTSGNGLTLVEPMGYLAFLDLVEHASVVVTDSGGIQEETSALGVPCVTLRTSTERPVTIRLGTNRLAGEDLAELPSAVRAALCRSREVVEIPLWDGHAAQRIVRVLEATVDDPIQPRLAG
jgi:UDP-N-acetylglucosamine 2-epimerase (non-hydrolysing)